MCCVITIPGTPCGSRGRILAMASVPPVEAPMAITVDGVHWLAACKRDQGAGVAGPPWRRRSAGAGAGGLAASRGGGVGGAACLTSAAGRLWRAAAAGFLEASASRNSPTEYGPLGLA